MFCGKCGTQNPDTNVFCKNCGSPLRRPQQAPAVPVQPAQPVYYQPQPADVQQPAPWQAATITKQPWPMGKKIAVISIVCGIGAFIVIPYILGIVGLIFGIFSITKKYMPGAAGIVISLIAMLVNYLYIFIS